MKDSQRMKRNGVALRKIDLNELPRYCRWPQALLENPASRQVVRDRKKIDQEYNVEKYGGCLRYYRQKRGAITAEDIRQFQCRADFQRALTQDTCMSVGKTLYATTLSRVHKHYGRVIRSELRKAIRASGAATVVELGCGYGYWLGAMAGEFSKKWFLGGEMSQSAVTLASELFRRRPNITVRPFNFYDARSYRLLEAATPPVLVVTIQAIEQVPHVDVVLDGLRPFRHMIRMVAHLEPVSEFYDRSLLGMMRCRYTELNDYNRNLWSQLSRRGVARVLKVQPEIIGVNPLNPISVIWWEFTGRRAA